MGHNNMKEQIQIDKNRIEMDPESSQEFEFIH